MMKTYVVYILASRPNGTLYIGLTSNIMQRIAQHKSGVVPGFTQRYGVDCLVYAEAYANLAEAQAREKQLKGWNRAWKLRLIGEANPFWTELDASSLGL